MFMMLSFVCLVRYARMLTFRRSTIRRFGANTSAMKKLAARDFEDILQVYHTLHSQSHHQAHMLSQCAMPAFDGLLPEPHYKAVLDMLFELATWHACAKLRLRTETTLTFMEKCTRSMGDAIRHFRKTVCPQYATKELPRETQQRHHRAAAAQKAKPAGTQNVQPKSSRAKSKGKGKATGAENEGMPDLIWQ